MRRGTTPTISLEVTNYDLSLATHIWVTFEQSSSGTEITREWERYPDPEEERPNHGITVNGSFVIVTLSQSETLQFVKGTVEVQVKMKQDDLDEDDDDFDTVVGSEIKKIKVEEILNEEVM